MSKTITGVISKCYHNRDRDTYAIILDGDKTWYGCYKTDYTHLEGKEVTFEAEKKGKYWNVAGDVEVTKAQAKATAANPVPATASADARQQSIVVQSSFKIATEIAAAGLAAGAFTLGPKKADAPGVLMGIVKELAYELYGYAINPQSFLDEFEDPSPKSAADDDYDPTDA